MKAMSLRPRRQGGRGNSFLAWSLHIPSNTQDENRWCMSLGIRGPSLYSQGVVLVVTLSCLGHRNT